MLGGRRYENFNSAADWAAFGKSSWQRLTWAEPIAKKHSVKLALENHKDWRIDEMLSILKRISSEHVGVNLDTGNNLALLEDPHAVVEALAPHTLTTHLKDMAVQEYDRAFCFPRYRWAKVFWISNVCGCVRKSQPARAA